MAIHFYIGSTESEYDEFKKKHNVTECTEEEEREIRSEFHSTFEQLDIAFNK